MTDGRCTLRLRRRYLATVDEVWAALLDGRWLGTNAPAIRVVEPRCVVELVFPDSVARVELSVDEDATLLVLEHTEIAAPVGMRSIRLWTSALARLAEGV